LKENVLDQASHCFGKLAAQMDYETAALDCVEIDLDGQIMEIPAIVVKCRPEDILVYPTVRTQLIAVDTPECPVVALGVEFPYQRSSLAGWYFAWLPMHDDHQRSFLRMLATSSMWHVVVFSGVRVTRVLMVPINQTARRDYRQLWKLIADNYPLKPEANTKLAIDRACGAMQEALGPGYVLQTIRTIGCSK
jgi:hypothetical protein